MAPTMNDIAELSEKNCAWKINYEALMQKPNQNDSSIKKRWTDDISQEKTTDKTANKM